MSDMDNLAALVRNQRERLLDTWRAQVRDLPGARQLDTPTITDHIPELLDELADALEEQRSGTIVEALHEATTPAHGAQRLVDGFDIEEVVAEYNILRGCLHDLADEHGIDLQGAPLRVLNRVLDGAIGAAVQTFAAEQAKAVQQRREEYLSFVIHDLRTPLGAISLATELLTQALEEPADRTRLDQVARTLRRNVVNLATLVDRVLEENGHLESETGHKLEWRAFDLWALVESLLVDLQPLANASRTRLVNDVPTDLVLHADATLTRRVFQNLIGNAIDHTPDGVVTVGALAPDRDGTVECWVRDDGVGISAERLHRVFDKHETDRRETGGLGLGLAIVKTLIEAHGGTVHLESAPGRGTCFTLRFPRQTS